MFPNLLNTPQLNFPQAPQAKSSGVNAGALLTSPFKAIGNAVSNFFNPKPLPQVNNTYQNTVANQFSGYKPLGLDTAINVPQINLPTLNTPVNTSTQQAQPTVVPTTKTVTTPPLAQTQQPTYEQSNVSAPQNLATQNFQQPQYTPPTPTTFGNSPISQDGYIPSTSLSSNSTYNDILAKRKQYEQQYQDALTRAGQVQIQGLQNVQDARYMGNTQDYSSAMGERALNNANLANLAATNQANVAGKLLDINQQDITNTLNAQPTNIGSNVNPATGDVYIQTKNPTTGQMQTVLAGNIGAQKQYTSTSVNQDPMTGNLIFTGVRQDGTIENQILSGGGTQGVATGGQTGTTGGIPFQLSGSTATAPNGQMYVNQDKLTPGLERAQTIAAKNAGIPVLSGSEVQTVRDVEYVKSSIAKVQDTIGQILSPGIAGRIQGLTVNPIKEFLQTDTQIATFQVYRDAAIKIIQSLAGGTGSGLRLNQAEINTAVSNIPTINDNYETASKKLTLVNSLLDSKVDTLFPNTPKSTSQTTGNSIIQTKVGAVDNSWFN